MAVPLLRQAGMPYREMAERAFASAPGSLPAWEALVATLVADKDADAIRAAAARLPVADPARVGAALEAAGDAGGAAKVYAEAMAGAEDPLPWSLRLEAAQTVAEDWEGVLDTLNRRIAASSGEVKAEAAGRARWVLAEKLADTAEAWEQYQKLHDANPDDVGVLETLARIAGARGETELALKYLDGLVRTAPTPADAVRYHRRIAEVHERNDSPDAARTALGKALEVDPTDAATLADLRRLAEAAGDWRGVVGVLARSAAGATGREQIERFAEIARLWEERIQDRTVAADAWRKVLELAPDDEEALRHLVALSEDAKDWVGVVDYGQALLAHLEGDERAGLMRRIGIVMAEHLRRDDEALRFFEGASSAGALDAESARVLERIYTGRGEHAKVVDALLTRARTTADAGERSESFTRAARIRLELLRDRAGAADIYGELLEADPEAHDALRFRAEHLWESGDYESAAALYGRMEPRELERDTDDFDTQVEVAAFSFRFAEALRRLGRADEAIRRYEQALGLNPTHLPSLEAVGPLYIASGDWAKAEKVFKQLLQLTGGAGTNEQLAAIYANLGTVELRLGSPEKARKRFAKALELQPNDISALKGLASMLFEAADWHNLLNIYNNIIYHTHDPADVIDAYLLKGFVLDARLGLADKAGQHYEKSLAFDPGQPTALLRLGELALRRQDWPEGASLAERGLQIAAGNAPLRASLLLVRAIAYQACGDAAAAAEGFEEAVRLDPWIGENLGGTTIEDHDAVHELLKVRLQSAPRL